MGSSRALPRASGPQKDVVTLGGLELLLLGDSGAGAVRWSCRCVVHVMDARGETGTTQGACRVSAQDVCLQKWR